MWKKVPVTLQTPRVIIFSVKLSIFGQSYLLSERNTWETLYQAEGSFNFQVQDHSDLKYANCEGNGNRNETHAKCKRTINQQQTSERSLPYSQIPTQPPDFKFSHFDSSLTDQLPIR